MYRFLSNSKNNNPSNHTVERRISLRHMKTFTRSSTLAIIPNCFNSCTQYKRGTSVITLRTSAKALGHICQSVYCSRIKHHLLGEDLGLGLSFRIKKEYKAFQQLHTNPNTEINVYPNAHEIRRGKSKVNTMVVNIMLNLWRYSLCL